MSDLPLTLFGLFALLLVIRVPISFSLGIASAICLVMLDVPLSVVPQRIFTALDSFPTMAIPFFILAGNLMTEGGISKRLVDFANSLLGNVRGGVAMACVLACAFFAALSGSGPATVVAIGSMLYPQLVGMGYPKEKVGGLITVSGGLGPIIPPSIIMVIYCTMTDNSVKSLFTAGFSAGMVITAALLLVTYVQAVTHKWPFRQDKITARERWQSLVRSALALAMPAIVLGGIYGGIFTPTEAAAIAVAYACMVSLFIYKDLNWGNVCRIMYDSAVSSSAILFIIACSSVFSWLFAKGGITAMVVNGITGLGMGYWSMIFMLSLILLVFGFFLEGTAIIVLLMPVMYPLAMSVGIDPIHFGIITCVAIVIGTMTPPVAVNIFACSTFSKLSVEEISRGELPWLFTMVAILFLLIVFPQISTFLL